MDKEMETITTPHDEKVYMHTEAEMEEIIETIVLIEIGHELEHVAKGGQHTFLRKVTDNMFESVLEMLAGTDAVKMFERIRERHERASYESQI